MGVVLGVAALIVIWAAVVSNGLMQLRVQADGAWSDIGVQLKRRYNLIPNVVEAVKGYAAHEQKVFQQVTEARARAIQAGSPKEQEAAEGMLAGALKSLFAVAENYPQLRASDNFLGLRQSLTQIEEALQAARRYYNAVVRDYNTKQQVFPDRLITQAGGFQPKEFFQLDSVEGSKNPRVSFS